MIKKDHGWKMYNGTKNELYFTIIFTFSLVLYFLVVLLLHFWRLMINKQIQSGFDLYRM